MARIFYSLVIIYYNYSWICNYFASMDGRTDKDKILDLSGSVCYESEKKIR